MDEEWRPVVGDTDYEVSSLGRVRSLDATIWYGPRVGFGYRTGRILKPSIDKHGYLTVRVGKLKTQKVHTLVALAFLGIRPKNLQCRHLDGNKQNPQLNNLAYGTPRENRLDAYRHGICNSQKDREIGRKARDTKSLRYNKNQIRSGFAGIAYSKVDTL